MYTSKFKVMEKVFLVFAHFFYKDGRDCKVLLKAFASKRLVSVYVDYKKLLFNRDGGSSFGDDDIHYVDFYVQEEIICSIDWSDDLKKLLDEKL